MSKVTGSIMGLRYDGIKQENVAAVLPYMFSKELLVIVFKVTEHIYDLPISKKDRQLLVESAEAAFLSGCKYEI